MLKIYYKNIFLFSDNELPNINIATLPRLDSPAFHL